MNIDQVVEFIDEATNGPVWLNYGDCMSGPYDANQRAVAAQHFLYAPGPNSVTIEDRDGNPILDAPYEFDDEFDDIE